MIGGNGYQKVNQKALGPARAGGSTQSRAELVTGEYRVSIAD
jgi:hypothetical protein